MKFSSFVLISMMVLFQSCGKDSNTASSTTNQEQGAETVFRSGLCSQNVVDDYNLMGRKITKTQSKLDLLSRFPTYTGLAEAKILARDAIEEIDRFVGKYPGTNCKAKKLFQNEINENKEFTITEEEILKTKKILEKVDSLTI